MPSVDAYQDAIRRGAMRGIAEAATALMAGLAGLDHRRLDPRFVAACARLGVDPRTSTATDIGRAYRRTIAHGRLHPDQGGNGAAFMDLTAARSIALATIA